MAMFEMNWSPTRRELRQFAAIMLIGGGVFGAVLRSYGHPSAAVVIWAVGGTVGVIGLALPAAVKWPFILLSLISWPIGYVVSHIVLAVFYYVIITGTGLIFRLMGRDPLDRTPDAGATSYWRPKTLPEAKDKERYFRQF